MIRMILLAIAAIVASFTVRADDHPLVTIQKEVADAMVVSVGPARHEGYKKECGRCHLVFQPGLLPARSWQKIMGNLPSHFSEKINLTNEHRKTITEYLTANAADHSLGKQELRIADSIPASQQPLRITETAYFVRKHTELARVRASVKSLTSCHNCHPRAMSGIYDKRETKIPGVGRWGD